MTVDRTLFAADKTGFHMLHALFQTSLKYDNIVRYDECFLTSLLVDDGKVRGVTTINLYTGQVEVIAGKAVILCTGGGGRIFPFTTNAAINTGDGMALAYRAGVPLKDMEFVQYHPTGLPGTGILITEASRGEGGWLKNKDGYRYLQDYGLGPPTDDTDTPQDGAWPARHPFALPHAGISYKGRTFEGPYGHYVHLDLRHLGEEMINKKAALRARAGAQVRRHRSGLRAHTRPPGGPLHDGRDPTDINARTILEGLYAAGETACVSINGANRLGSNSLTELLVFGERAGRAAAQYAGTQAAPAV